MCKISFCVIIYFKRRKFYKNNLYFNTGELSIVIKELKCKMIKEIKMNFITDDQEKDQEKV